MREGCTGDRLAKPRAVLDQWTGVYVRGETLTVTCTVTGDNREKYFKFYKDKQRLSTRRIDRNVKIGSIRVTDRRSEGRYACQYGISVGGRQLISPMSETVEVTISDPLATPRAVLDQSTGVYVRGETLTITCTVTGDNREKYFNFYKDKQRLSSYQIDRNVKTGRFGATDRRSEGRYACQYEISVGGRQLISPMSEAVDVTISDPLAKPRAVLDQWTGVYVRGETLTITCTVTGDHREKYFNFYKDKQRLSFRQIDRKNKIGPFRVADRSNEGRYACQYGISAGGRQLISPMSETVDVTISDPLKKPRAVLDQSTGVYVRGETLTITCTVTGDNREKYFNFYKDKQRLSSRQIVRNDNFGTFRATGRRSEGRYACQYEISVSGRQLISRMSETVEVTIS
ncbi:platelet endothelial cell adhesion molecule-like, partial [Scyliorhinus torazame]|uniref:platelet endothelial cell adhesion molecule-like n=1 Tax=Scyliorhinus torazame TaxID=75743 RepID=UPI003B59EDE0